MAQADVMKMNTFLMSKYWSEAVYCLSDEQAGILFKALFKFAEGEDPEIEDLALRGLYRVMRRGMSKHARKYWKKAGWKGVDEDLLYNADVYEAIESRSEAPEEAVEEVSTEAQERSTEA